MEIGPIFRALMHNKTRFWLITVEVALTFAVVANCVNVLLDLRSDYIRTTGYDEENIVVTLVEPFDAEFEEDSFRTELRDRDLDSLNAHPGIHGALLSQAVPLSGGGSGTGRKALGSELETSTAPFFRVYGDVLPATGVELVAGRSFKASDWDYKTEEDGTVLHRNAMVTQDLADDLFPDGEALGQTIQNDEGEVTNTIIGIVGDMHNSWPVGWEKANNTMLVPERDVDPRRYFFLIRTDPGAAQSMIPEIEQIFTANHPGRLVRSETLQEVKNDTYSQTTGVIKILTSVVALLLFVTALGIVGLTSFSVTQRTRQIGTRRALGASRTDIIRYFRTG